MIPSTPNHKNPNFFLLNHQYLEYLTPFGIYKWITIVFFSFQNPENMSYCSYKPYFLM
jgi:hypothetical protein